MGQYTVQLAGTDFRAGNFSGSVSSAGRTEVTVDVYDPPTTIQFWDTLKILEAGTRIFEGIITYAEIYAPDNNNNDHYYTLKCADYSEISKYRTVTAEVVDMTAQVAITTYLMPVLNEEGITAGTISADWYIERDVWGTIPVYDVLEKLIQAAPGYIWYVDMDKKLHYYKKTAGSIEYLNDTDEFTNFKQTRDFSNYRNVQHAHVDKVRTDTQVLVIPSPLPDGTVKTFTLNFSVAEKPTIYVNSVAVAASEVGVNGIDDDTTGIKWFFSYDSNTITQANSETPLAATDVLEVTYVGLRSGIITFSDYNKIAERKIDTPDFSGIAESVVKVEAFDTLDQISYYVEQLIEKLGFPGDKATFDTTDSRFTVGKRVVINARNRGGLRLMIDQVSFSTDGYITTYSITAYDEAYVGGAWEEWFYKVILGQSTYNLNSADTLYQTVATPETIDAEGTYTIGLSGTGLLLPFTLPGTLGGSDYTEVIIND